MKDDGRRRLHADGRQYDIIVADSVWTDVTMSNNLYSMEFYKLVKDSLKPGGVMCILAKTDRILAAVRRVFPYAIAFREDFLLVSSEPIVLDKELWLERLKSPGLVDYLGKGRTREVSGSSCGPRSTRLPWPRSPTSTGTSSPRTNSSAPTLPPGGSAEVVTPEGRVISSPA